MRTVLCGPFKEISRVIFTISHYVTPLINSVEDVIALSRTCSTPVSPCAGCVRTAPFVMQHLPCMRHWATDRGAGRGLGLQELRAQPRRRRPVGAHRPAVLLRINLAGRRELPGDVITALEIPRHLPSVTVLRKLRLTPQHRAANLGAVWAPTPGFRTLELGLGFIRGSDFPLPNVTVVLLKHY